MFGSLGPGEIILILVVLLLVFGAKRLPELGGALGKGIREFKSSVKDIQSGMNVDEQPRSVQPPQAQASIPQQPPQQQAPQNAQPVQQPVQQQPGTPSNVTEPQAGETKQG